jgi:hypothetical protein
MEDTVIMILVGLPFYASTFLDSFKVGARYVQISGISGPNGSALSSSQYISYSQNS